MGSFAKKGILCFILVTLHSLSFAEIRIIPKERTPEPNDVDLDLVYPHSGEVKSSNIVPFELRLEGYPLGTDTEYQIRARELHNDSIGQSICILIDNDFCIEMDEALIDALDNNAPDYFEQRITGQLNCELTEGEHLLQAFPIRSYNESLKGKSSYVASIFYVKTKTNNHNYDLSKPYLIYNQPIGKFAYSSTRPILLDFLIKNCQLSSDGYKICLSINGHIERMLTAWIPYYIYGLPKGTHKIQLQLLDANGKLVPSFFNDLTKTIIVE